MEKRSTIHSYLKTSYTPEESREALYRAAVAAADENWTLMDASFQLGDKAKEDGIAADDVDKIIRRAFSSDRRGRDRKPESTPGENNRGRLDLDAESLKLLESRRINPDDLMIPWPADDWRKDLLKLLEAAFLPHETIDFKIAETPQPHRETVGTILAQSDNIGKIMKSLDGPDGALVSLNSTSCEAPKDDSWRLRYAVVDSPRMSLSKQLAFYKALNLPCVALVNSGANSVQAWVRIEASDTTEYNERVDFLYATLEENGFKVDPSLKSANLMVRMPGVLRNGKQQYLIGLNEGAKSWKDWQEWVDYCLDGNPLVEQASHHQHAPTPDSMLIDGICKAGDLFVLSAPPKTGKSLALIDCALAIAHGEEWMGLHTQESDVLFVNFDLSKSSFLNRLHLIGSERKLDPSTQRIGFLSLRGYRKPILEMAELLVRRIEGARKYEDRDYKAVFIDPALAMLRGAGSSNPGNDLAMLCDIICAKTGAAVLIALTPADISNLELQPDGLLELIATEDRPTIFQLRGSFKEFPPLIGKECAWSHPRYTL